MQTVKTIITVLLICWGCINAHAQVTIGSLEKPVKGAILDIKSQVSDINNVTSKSGGLVLSRVDLVNKNTLEPFIKTGSAEWTADTKLKHTGLLVYNLKEDNSFFHPGIYVWDGDSWGPVTGSYIQLPAFNLPWVTTSQTFNLFDEVYKKNFAPASTVNYISSAGAGVTDFPPYDDNPANFYYVVTDYDPAVYDIISIASDGVMTYSCIGSGKPAAEGNNLRINVVMIKK
ncbi:hypothetical protein FACS189432_04000 [Bacteroidia bacterium]|nr:hypothetical protein FACS189426_10980 [Bacteroidia bacterium]GHT27440.1 hypothetical protein FACS189432_04000 [Bacteroidia bacterium]GHV71100.1 hypothetical protein FACS189420_4900 [Bacteroidia bacterium]